MKKSKILNFEKKSWKIQGKNGMLTPGDAENLIFGQSKRVPPRKSVRLCMPCSLILELTSVTVQESK